MAKEKTALGLDENIEGALCYLLGWITGIIFYVLEPKNKFVRFHAMQSIIVFLPLMVLAWLFGGFFGIFGWWSGLYFMWICSWILWVIFFILWIILMLKAFQGEKYKLPIAGDIAEKNS